MKTWNEIVIESKSVGVIYHYTNFSSLKSIVSSGMIIDTLNRGYVSFTRNGSGLKKFGMVRLVIDGNKLSNKYKIVPDSLAISPNSREIIKLPDGTPYYKTGLEKEAEERIYQKHVKINECIIQIDILDPIVDSSELYDMYELIKKPVIKVKLFKPYK